MFLASLILLLTPILESTWRSLPSKEFGTYDNSPLYFEPSFRIIGTQNDFAVEIIVVNVPESVRIVLQKLNIVNLEILLKSNSKLMLIIFQRQKLLRKR
jgi:hypothetical protein